MRQKYSLHNGIRGLGALALSALTCVAVSAVAPAHSDIVNIATVHYSDGVNDYSFTTAPSRVRVAAVPGLDLSSDQSVSFPAGMAATLVHTLTNTGNVADSYTLSLSNQAGDQYDFASAMVYHDVDGSNTVTPGDTLLASLSTSLAPTPLLSPGDSVPLVISASVPALLNQGDSGQLQLVATSTANAAVQDSNLDTVSVSADLFLNVSKSASTPCTTALAMGENINYQLQVGNIGTNTPSPLVYSIDGAPQTGIILQDPLPTGVELLAGQALSFSPASATPVVRLSSASSPAEWLQYSSWNGTDAVAAMGLWMPVSDLEPGETRHLDFAVQVRNDVVGASVTINNIAGVDTDLDGTLDFASAAVCNTVHGHVYAHTLLADVADVATPGAVFSSVHTLSNTQTSPDHYQLSLINLPGDDFDFSNLQIIHDLNADGLVDAGEPVLATTPVLAAMSSIQLIVQGTVPLAAADGEQAVMQLSSTSLADAAQNHSVTATATVEASGGALTVSKTASNSISCSNTSPSAAEQLAPGSLLDYHIAVTGVTPRPSALSYLVDGVAQIGLVVEDTIPANTQLESSSISAFQPATAQVLVQLAGDVGSDRWVSFASWQASSQSGANLPAKLGLLIPVDALDAGETASLDFALRTPQTVTPGTRIANAARLLDGVLNPESETVCHALAAAANGAVDDNQAIIRFIEPRNALQVADQLPDWSDDNDFQDTQLYRLNSFPGYSASENGVFLEVRSTSLNSISYLADGETGVIHVRLESLTSNDFIQVVMLETTPNSGVFRSIRPVILSQAQSGSGSVCPAANYTPQLDAAEPANCTLRSSSRDRLRASITDPGTASLLVDAAVVDPLGVVFDSQTGALIAGAVVSVINASTGQLALDPDTGGATALQPQVTGADGFYQFPRMFPGSYYIQVESPATHQPFPSGVALADLPAGFNVSNYSYGRDGFDDELGARRGIAAVVANSGVFSLSASNPLAIIDIPLDPFLTPGTFLKVSKGIVVGAAAPVSQAEVELGDRVKYQVTVSNAGTMALAAVVLRDVLPFGFKFANGSALRDGAAIVPSNIAGAELRFNLGNLPAGQSTTLSYILATTAGALDSNGINTAQASAGLLASNIAQARVEVSRSGLLSERSIVFGKTYVDANCDGLQAKAEWPVAGVRIYMEDGTYVTTDEHGMYSLYGIKPGQHVLKVDSLSLPTGIAAVPTTTRHGADPYSRFVDVTDGEFHRADFVFACPGENAASVVKQLEARHRSIAGDWLLDEAMKYSDASLLLQNRSGLQAKAQRQDEPAYDGDISSGVLGREASSCCTNKGNNSAQATATEPKPPLADYPHSVVREMPKTEDVIATVTQAMAKQGTWLWPQDDISYGGRFSAVVRAGVKPRLYLNGVKVASDRLGEHMLNKAEKAQVMAWYGLPLQVGDNELQLKALDPFGNERMLAQRVVYHPGNVQSLRVTLQHDSLPADAGRSSLPYSIELLDKNARPAKGFFFVTLEAEHGQWLEPDVQTQVQGHQIKVVNGRAQVHLRSSEYVGAVKTRVSLDKLQQTNTVHFLPVLRPLLAVGLIDIGAHYSKVSDNGVQPSAQKDGYADSLEVEGRAALFLKGKVKGDMLLTLSYDSDKDKGELFRDIDPNAYYPIYGDASAKGFDAQSQSKLYVKLEKNKNSVMWGDYQTDSQAQHKSSLGRVSDSLTGLNAHYEKDSRLGKTRISAYAARADQLTQTEELRGRGTATGYRLSNFPAEPNSEQISIITIDRENTLPGSADGLVIAERVLQRFKDYDLNHLNGFITFFEPIASFDEQGNEQFIRISYQTEQAVDEYSVAGVRASQSLAADTVLVGASISHSDEDTEGYKMASVFAQFKPNDKHSLMAEVASRDNEDNSVAAHRGEAAQLEWQAKWNKRFDTALKVARADEGFKNTVAPIASGREEARLKARLALSDKTTLDAELIHSASVVAGNDEQRDSAALTATRRIGQWSLTGGVKRTEQTVSGDGDDIDSLLGRVERGFSLGGRKGKAHLALEQEVGAASRKRLELGSEYQLHDKLSLYVRAEQIDSLSSATALSTQQRRVNASLGLKSNWLPSTQLYSEYRLDSAIDGRDLQAVNGVRGNYELKPKLTFSPALEVIDTLDGDDSRDAIALSLGLVDNSNKNLRQAIRIETRQAQQNDFYSLDYSYAARINRNWSALYRDQFRLDKPKSGERTRSNLLTLGLARRPLHNNRWHSLYLLQWKEERNIVEDERSAYIVSTHQNYQFREDVTLSARLAAKLQTQVIDQNSYDSTAQLIGGRIIWGLNRRWDMDVRLGLLSAEVGEDVRYAAGVGAHYLINKNLRFGLGVNVVGFDDDDLDSHNYHAEGLFFGLQYKFDEALFEWLR